MVALLKLLWNKWITPASTQIWLLVAGAFGALVIVVKWMGKRNSTLKTKNDSLEAEVKRAERINNVKTTTTRDDALDRLRMRGSVRDDRPD